MEENATATFNVLLPITPSVACPSLQSKAGVCNNQGRLWPPAPGMALSFAVFWEKKRTIAMRLSSASYAVSSGIVFETTIAEATRAL